jgi:hypothetical protein
MSAPEFMLSNKTDPTHLILSDLGDFSRLIKMVQRDNKNSHPELMRNITNNLLWVSALYYEHINHEATLAERDATIEQLRAALNEAAAFTHGCSILFDAKKNKTMVEACDNLIDTIDRAIAKDTK